MKNGILILTVFAGLIVSNFGFAQHGAVSDSVNACRVNTAHITFPRDFTVNANTRRTIGHIQGIGECNVSNNSITENVTVVANRSYNLDSIYCHPERLNIVFLVRRAGRQIQFLCSYQSPNRVGTVRQLENLMGGVTITVDDLRQEVRDVQLKTSGSTASEHDETSSVKEAN